MKIKAGWWLSDKRADDGKQTSAHRKLLLPVLLGTLIRPFTKPATNEGLLKNMRRPKTMMVVDADLCYTEIKRKA